MNREQLRELHERLLGQPSINTVVLLDRDRVVVWLLRRDGDQDHVLTPFVEGVRRNDQRGAPFRGAEIGEGKGDEDDVAALQGVVDGIGRIVPEVEAAFRGLEPPERLKKIA